MYLFYLQILSMYLLYLQVLSMYLFYLQILSTYLFYLQVLSMYLFYLQVLLMQLHNGLVILKRVCVQVTHTTIENHVVGLATRHLKMKVLVEPGKDGVFILEYILMVEDMLWSILYIFHLLWSLRVCLDCLWWCQLLMHLDQEYQRYTLYMHVHICIKTTLRTDPAFTIRIFVHNNSQVAR